MFSASQKDLGDEEKKKQAAAADQMMLNDPKMKLLYGT